jgi:hypothetical protein
MACALVDGLDREGWEKGACHAPLLAIRRVWLLDSVAHHAAETVTIGESRSPLFVFSSPSRTLYSFRPPRGFLDGLEMTKSADKKLPVARLDRRGRVA